jgi:sugar phosphate isomerase/epimerase
MLSRRTFLSAAALAGVRMAWTGAAQAALSNGRFPACAFVKYLQSLSFDELAEAISGLGFDGIEATVRTKGQIEPERAADELPRLVEALKKKSLEITIMASSINRADQPLTEKVLKTAAGLGIKRYRMDYYKYDLAKPVAQQLADFKPMAKDLAALNKQLGIQAIYQNHAGAQYAGAALWDLHLLLEDIPKEQIGIAYDIRHATVEGGKTWPVTWNLVQPHLAAVYIKNARWEGRKLDDGPLGMEQGVVDPVFFKMLAASSFSGPISLHVEYLEQSTAAENLAAIKTDWASLKKLMGATN